MRIFAKLMIATTLLSLSVPAYAAGGWTAQVVPTEVELVQSGGFLLYGNFGSSGPTACSRSDAIWIAKTQPDYTEFLAVALSAVSSQMKVKAYVHSCAMVGWVGSTFNELSGGGALRVSR